jgi:hypothetical protein
MTITCENINAVLVCYEYVLHFYPAIATIIPIPEIEPSEIMKKGA